jgi:hypothetical protein
VLNLDESTLFTALKWLLAAFTPIAGWKLWMRARQDRRQDKAETRDDDAGDAAQRVFERTIARLEGTIDAMGKRLDAEIAVRREMEAEAATLRRRVDRAEQAAEQAFARQRAAEEMVDLFRAQIAALEMEVTRLEKLTGPPMFRDEI